MARMVFGVLAAVAVLALCRQAQAVSTMSWFVLHTRVPPEVFIRIPHPVLYAV